MALQIFTSKICVSIFFFKCILILFLSGFITAQQISNTTIGAIIDVGSRRGKEEKVSMEMAIQAFNNVSNNSLNLVLQVIDSGGKPLQDFLAAENFIAGKKVQAIVGLGTWPEAAWVSEIANQAQLPVLSLVAPSISPPLASVRWPYLVRMAKNDSSQVHCVASIVKSYGWRRVIAIYEDDGSGILALLSGALQLVGSEIEHWSAFPPLATLSDPNTFVSEELDKLNSTQSRVFIILRSSLELSTYVLQEANRKGLMGKDSVWIITDSLADLLDAVNSTVLSFMQGVIGIKTHINHTNPSLKDFSLTFRSSFRSRYPKEEKSEPGYNAVRAYDTITTVAFAIQKSRGINGRTTSPTLLIQNILSSNFKGLSGEVRFEERELSSLTTYEIVNVVGTGYITLKFWTPEYGFSDEAIDARSQTKKRSDELIDSETMNELGDRVYWPGGLKRIPLGWVMPSESQPMIIGVPGKTAFDQFVKVKPGEEPTGFCIEVFKSAVGLLHYDLPHKFVPFDGSYDDLVNQVYYKNFSAVVGDITILSGRSDHVEFTQPYAESALTMVVPVKPQQSPWLIIRPFKKELWIVVTIVFLYTMFIVWFFENGSNPEFKGPWTAQVSNAAWFICATLFFAHRESFRSNYTRVVMFFWLVTVFIVTSSYIASLTSMLTVKRLEPMFTDIETLRRDDLPVGCDTGSFLRTYLEDVLHFPRNKIISIPSEYDYPGAFENGTIKAAFLELPYERVFLSRNSTNYIDSGFRNRFGGLAFAFPKGSPFARDFSKAFLKLSEDGTLSNIDHGWFGSYSSCLDNSVAKERLSLDSFWPLFVALALISTILLVIYIVRKKMTPLYQRFRNWISGRPSDSPSVQGLRCPDTPRSPTASEIEMGEASTPRLQRSASSFAGWNRRDQDFNYEPHGWERVPRDA